jgi:uncharacterized membrane protein
VLKLVLLVLMSAFYVFAGIMHFVRTEFFLAIMPPALPWPRALVHVSGLAEITLGLALLFPPLRAYAAWGIIALLVAVFPANIYAAMASVPGAGGWFRLPFQALFIAWAWWYTR